MLVGRQTAFVLIAAALFAAMLPAIYAEAGAGADPELTQRVLDGIGDARAQLGTALTGARVAQAGAQGTQPWLPAQVVPEQAIPQTLDLGTVLDAISTSIAETPGALHAAPQAVAADGLEITYFSVTLSAQAGRAVLREAFPFPKTAEVDVSTGLPRAVKSILVVNPRTDPLLGDEWNTPPDMPVIGVEGELAQYISGTIVQQEDYEAGEPAILELTVEIPAGEFSGWPATTAKQHTLYLDYGPWFGDRKEITLLIYNDVCRGMAQPVALGDDYFASAPVNYRIEAKRAVAECYAETGGSEAERSQSLFGNAKQRLDEFILANQQAIDAMEYDDEKKERAAELWKFASLPDSYNQTKCSMAQANLMLKDFGGLASITALRDYYRLNCEAGNAYADAENCLEKAAGLHSEIIAAHPENPESIPALYGYAESMSVLHSAGQMRYAHLSFIESSEVMHYWAQSGYWELFRPGLTGIHGAGQAEAVLKVFARLEEAESELGQSELATDAQHEKLVSDMDAGIRFYQNAAGNPLLAIHASYLKEVVGGKKKLYLLEHGLEEAPNDWGLQQRILEQERGFRLALINSNPDPGMGDGDKSAAAQETEHEIENRRLEFAKQNFLVDIDREVQELNDFIAITEDGVEKHFRASHYLYYPTTVGGLISGEVEQHVISEQDAVGEAENQVTALEMVRDKIEAGEAVSSLGFRHVPKFATIATLDEIVRAQKRMPTQEERAEAYYTEAEHYMNRGAAGSEERLLVPLMSIAKATYRDVAEQHCSVQEKSEEIESATECDSSYGELAAASYNDIEIHVPVYETLAPWFGMREWLVATVAFEYVLMPVGRAVLVPVFERFIASRIGGFTASVVRNSVDKVATVTRRFVSRIPYIESMGRAAVNVVRLPGIVEKGVLDRIALRYPRMAKLLGTEFAELMPKPGLVGVEPAKMQLTEGGAVPKPECAAGCTAYSRNLSADELIVAGNGISGAVMRTGRVGRTETVRIANAGRVEVFEFGEMAPYAGGNPRAINLQSLSEGQRVVLGAEELAGFDNINIRIGATKARGYRAKKTTEIPEGSIEVEMRNGMVTILENPRHPRVIRIMKESGWDVIGQEPLAGGITRLTVLGADGTEQVLYKTTSAGRGFYTITKEIAPDIDAQGLSGALTQMGSMRQAAVPEGVEHVLAGKGSAFRGNSVKYASDIDMSLFIKVQTTSEQEARAKAAQLIQEMARVGERQQGLEFRALHSGKMEYPATDVLARRSVVENSLGDPLTEVSWFVKTEASDGTAVIKNINTHPVVMYEDAATGNLIPIAAEGKTAAMHSLASGDYAGCFFLSREDAMIATGMLKGTYQKGYVTGNLDYMTQSFWDAGKSFKSLKRYETLKMMQGNKAQQQAALEIISGDPGITAELSADLTTASELVGKYAAKKPFEQETLAMLKNVENRIVDIKAMPEALREEILIGKSVPEAGEFVGGVQSALDDITVAQDYAGAAKKLKDTGKLLDDWANQETERLISENSVLYVEPYFR